MRKKRDNMVKHEGNILMEWPEAYRQLVSGKKICMYCYYADETGRHDYKDYWYINADGHLVVHREDGIERDLSDPKWLLEYLEMTTWPSYWTVIQDKT